MTTTPITMRRHHRVPKKLWIPLAIILLLFVIVYIFLDVWLTRYVNKVLANDIKGYRGSVETVDVHLLRGAYEMKGLKIDKLDGKIPTPFLAIDSVDMSLQWSALLHGRIVSDIHLTRPILNFAKAKDGTRQTGKGANWNETVKKLMPIDINLITLENGAITYKDFSSTPATNIFINNLSAEVRNLRNVVEKNDPLPAKVQISGTSIGKGKLKAAGAMNILNEPMDMDIKGQLEKADLTSINDYVRNSAAFDFEKGTLSVYTHLVVKHGVVSGYIKPIAEDVHVITTKNTNPIEFAWRVVVGAVLEVFTNQRKDQFATQIPLEGNISKPETGIVSAIWAIVHNAFINSFSHNIKDEMGDVAK